MTVSKSSKGLGDYDRPVSIMLQTPRLVIRPLEDRDADAWLAMFADLEVTQIGRAHV